MLHLLLFTSRVFSIMRRLLQLAIEQDLLLRHLLPHVIEHLEVVPSLVIGCFSGS